MGSTHTLVDAKERLLIFPANLHVPRLFGRAAVYDSFALKNITLAAVTIIAAAIVLHVDGLETMSERMHAALYTHAV